MADVEVPQSAVSNGVAEPAVAANGADPAVETQESMSARRYPATNRADDITENEKNETAADSDIPRTVKASEHDKAVVDKIRRQVEFYFSEANLHKDKFFMESTRGSQNIPFPLAKLHTFNRMKQYQPYSLVEDAVRGSKVLKLDSEGGVSREVPISEEWTMNIRKNRAAYDKKYAGRTIYVKGLTPETESEKIETLQTELEDFFRGFGEIIQVRVRRVPKQGTKRSATVEFADEETQASFLALDPKPKFKDTTLEIQSWADWAAEKEAYLKSQGDDFEEVEYGSGRTHNTGKSKRGGHGNAARNDRRGGGRNNNNRNHRDRQSRDAVPSVETATETADEKAPAAEVAGEEKKVEDAAPATTKRAREDDAETEEGTESKKTKTEEA